MKIELIKKNEINGDIFYNVTINGVCHASFFDNGRNGAREQAEKAFESAKHMKYITEVLRSEEV